MAEKREFHQESKGDKPVIAICYDFDKTLTPNNMQAQGYIQSLGYTEENDFWDDTNAMADQNDMDQNLAYMFKMLKEAKGKLKKDTLNDYGSKITLFAGVEDWFKRIKDYGESKGILVEHYIISSGLKEMIEGTKPAKAAFKKIYASSFYYNEQGEAEWPAQAINYTNKTQFLFRIAKGCLDINDPAINNYLPPSEIRVPFRNMIYIGDSATDIPCMKLVNSYGGSSIGVYQPEDQSEGKKKDPKGQVLKMIRENRIKYFALADYREGTELDTIVKIIIDRTAFQEKLEEIHFQNEKEAQKNKSELS